MQIIDEKKIVDHEELASKFNDSEIQILVDIVKKYKLWRPDIEKFKQKYKDFIYVDFKDWQHKTLKRCISRLNFRQ